MGGYIAYEIVRQAPERVTTLALLDTGSRADAPERSAARRELIALAEREGTREAQAQLMPVLIHKARLADKPLVEADRADGRRTPASRRSSASRRRSWAVRTAGRSCRRIRVRRWCWSGARMR